MKYNLVNPYLSSKQISSSHDNPVLAGEEVWTSLSNNIKNIIPEFHFSIQNEDTKDLHHMRVSETVDENGAKYLIKELNKEKYHANDATLLSEIEKLNIDEQVGSGKYDDSSSSDSSSSSSELTFKLSNKNKNSYSNVLNNGFNLGYGVNPVYSLNYYPSIYGLRKVILPSFVGSYTPYVNIVYTPLSIAGILR